MDHSTMEEESANEKDVEKEQSEDLTSAQSSGEILEDSRCSLIGRFRDSCLVLSTQSQLSEISTGSDSGSQLRGPCTNFRKYPLLRSVFTESSWNENRQRSSKCVYCKESITTNRTARLLSHVAECVDIDSEVQVKIMNEYKEVIDMNGQTDANYRRNLKLAAMIVENNLPMRMVESKTFKQFVNDLNKEYQHPDRAEMSRSYIPKLSDTVERSFLDSVSTMDDFSLTIEFDHWQDLSYRSVLGVAAIKPDGSRFLFDLEDVSMIGHSAKEIMKTLDRCMKGLPPRKINSLISDSASNVKAARNRLTLSLDYCHVIEHRCLAHLLNNIGADFSKREPMKDILQKASKLTNYMSNDVQLIAKIHAAKLHKTKSESKTRWRASMQRHGKFLLT